MLGIPVLAIALLLGCEPDEHLTTVPNNTPPPDTLVERQTVESYVNRVYLNALGSKPASAVFQGAVDTLMAQNLHRAGREAFVASVLATEAHRNRLYEETRSQLLNGADTTTLRFELQQQQQALATDTLPAYIETRLAYEIERMQALLAAYADFRDGILNLQGLHRRMVNNAAYDDINMGAQNFVLSLFEHFLGRTPTQEEETISIAMINGQPGVLFFEEGHSKQDFITLFLQSDNYYAGQAHEVYQRYLFRAPSAQEAQRLSALYRSAGSLTALEADVLTSDEYTFRSTN